jgi:hypothetical protein
LINLNDNDIPEDAFRLRDLMSGVLQAVVDLYQSYNIPLPERRYTTMASATVDCEQVTVSFVNAYLGTPGDEANIPLQCDSIKSAVLSVTIARKIPTATNNSSRGAKTPDAEVLQDISDIAAIDSWVLLDNLQQFDPWTREFGAPMGVIATVNAEKSSGGYQTVSLQLTVAVP